MKLKSKTLSLLLCIALLCSLSSCTSSGNTDNSALFTGEYFSGMSLAEYRDYVYETFITLVPHVKAPAELGVSNMQYSIGSTGEPLPAAEYDKVTEGNGRYGMIVKSLPVFYGLLVRAEEYEKKMGIDSSAAAEKHGKQHALRADSVEKIYRIIMKDNCLLTHGSADGAEYIESEGIYVYDMLENPYQDRIDKGWTLKLLPYTKDFVEWEWGSEHVYISDFTVIWYDPDGMVYDIYGQKLMKMENPREELQDRVDYMNKIAKKLYSSSVQFEGYFNFSMIGGESEQDMVERDAPITFMNFGVTMITS